MGRNVPRRRAQPRGRGGRVPRGHDGPRPHRLEPRTAGHRGDREDRLLAAGARAPARRPRGGRGRDGVAAGAAAELGRRVRGDLAARAPAEPAGARPLEGRPDAETRPAARAGGHAAGRLARRDPRRVRAQGDEGVRELPRGGRRGGGGGTGGVSPDALPTALARVRSRARVARLAAVLPWALAAGAAAYAIGHLAGAGVAAPVLLGAAVALVALLGGLVAWGAWRPLTDARVARLADDRLGQRDLFSSAIEVSPAASVVAMALHLEAGRRSDQVRAADVVALRLPRGGTLALVVVLAAGALVQLWTAGRGPLSAGVSAEDAASVERVLELAEVTAAAAEARRDPHLAAVATALAELAEEAAARGERTIADVERLEGLVAALERLAMPAGSLGARSARAPGEDVPLGETMAGLEERLASMARLSGQGEAPTYDPETTWLEGDLVRQEPVLGDAPNLSRPPGAAAGEAPDGLDAAPSQADGDAES